MTPSIDVMKVLEELESLGFIAGMHKYDAPFDVIEFSGLEYTKAIKYGYHISW